MSTLEGLFAANAGLLGIIGFFLKRSLNDISRTLHNVVDTQNRQTVSIAVLESRFSRFEIEFGSTKVKYDDLAGFLQAQGFRKRDGP